MMCSFKGSVLHMAFIFFVLLPFYRILPLEAICGRIQADVMATLKEGEKTRNLRNKVLLIRGPEHWAMVNGHVNK
jgi:hypothetical protein